MEFINSNELNQDRSNNINESQIGNSFTYYDWMLLSAVGSLVIFLATTIIVGIKEIIKCLS